METNIRCKKCGHNIFIRTTTPAIPMHDDEIEVREFACANCGELMYYECLLAYTPEYDPETGLTSYHDVLDDELSTEPDDDYDNTDLFDTFDYDDDGGFDPGIG